MGRGRGRPSTLKRWRARLRGEWYRLRFVPQSELDAEMAEWEEDGEDAQTAHTEALRGLCVRNETRRDILILQGQRGRDEMDTAIHEMLHACQWDLSEEAVEEIACDIAAAMWRGGWRRVKK